MSFKKARELFLNLLKKRLEESFPKRIKAVLKN